tara:strand:+ start:2609 stop:3055 length:447 start_codon:yes stop_codon:yes gene_type:complete
MHKRKGGVWAQIKQARGTVTFDTKACNAFADALCDKLDQRLINLAKKFDRTYEVRPSTVAYMGDTLTPLRASLLMEIRYAIQSYAKKEWSWVKAHMSTINTKWLDYHRAAVKNMHVQYTNAQDIHTKDNFIPLKERNTFGRRKKPSSK